MIDRTEYAPYGSIVATAATQNIGNNYKFTGKEADSENNLQYFGARYYDNRVGKFTSIDPAMLALAKDDLLRASAGRELDQILTDPQLLNSYSYSRNNPVTLIDPDGQFVDTAIDIAFIGYDLYQIGKGLVNGHVDNTHYQALGLDMGGALIPGVTGLGLTARAAKGVEKAEEVVSVVSKAEKTGEVTKVTKGAAEWAATSFNAAKQQVEKLKGVTNVKVENLIKKTYQATDSIVGGTSGAATFTKKTGELVGGSDHIQRNWDTFRGGLNILKDQTLNSRELREVKDIIKKAWRANYK